MRNHSNGKPLPPIGGFIPVPDAVIELGDTDAAYEAWDSAWASFDHPADQRAAALAEAT